MLVGFDGKLYVSDYANNSVQVFNPGASGNVAPAQSITTTGFELPRRPRAGRQREHLRDGLGGAQVPVFAANANGASTPIANLKGSYTTFE